MATTKTAAPVKETLTRLGFIESVAIGAAPVIASAPIRPRAIAASAAGTRRIEQIDAMRFLAFCTVALIHVAWTDTREVGAYTALLTLLRYSLPFFYMTAGWVIAVHGRCRLDHLPRVARRLGLLFVVWIALYNFVHFFVHDLGYRPMPTTLREATVYLAATLNSGGVAFHLWFLPWLGVSIAIWVGLGRFAPRALWPVVIGLYGLGLAVGPYNEFTGLFEHVARIYPDPIAFTGRNGPFFGPLFVALGGWLATRHRRIDRVPTDVLATVALAGLVLFVGEAIFICGHGVKMVANFNFLVGSLLFAPALFLIGLRLPVGPAISAAARLGRLGVGMYCVHGFFTLLYNQVHTPAMRLETPLWFTFFAAAGVVALSVATTLVLARVPGLRRLVG